tara:strand:- start:2119 stop:3774 length:1656 start_codon:yes stop_codon:yes gene_type:complete
LGVSGAEGVAMTIPSKISTLQQQKKFFAVYLKEGLNLDKIDLDRTIHNRVFVKIKDCNYLLRGIVVLFLFLFPGQSFAKKIKLSDSIILEQKNSLNTNYSYKNQNTYFNQINSNKVKNDSGNFYAKINSSLKVTKKYSKTKKIGFFGNIVANYTNKSDQNDQYHSYLEKSYLFFQEKFGKFEFGKNIATNKKMAISTHSFARGSGGVSGGYLRYLNLPILRNGNDGDVNQIGLCDGYNSLNSTIFESGNCSKIKLPKFILLPTTPISHGGYATGFYHNISDNNYDNQNSNKLFGFGGNKSNNRINDDNSLGNLQNSLKLNYYTNRIDGFQVGFGYVINAKNDLELDSNNDTALDLGNIYSWGLNYSNYFNNIGFGASITGEYGKINNIYDQNNLNSYEVGLMFTYFGFTLGGSYGNWGDSMTPKSGIYSCDYNSNLTLNNQNCTQDISRFKDSYYLNAGISYEIGPMGSSLTYLKSNFQKNIYQVTVFSIDYKLKKSLKSYLELAKFDFNSNNAKFLNGPDILNQGSLPPSQRQIADNDGYVILIGTLFKF